MFVKLPISLLGLAAVLAACTGAAVGPTGTSESSLLPPQPTIGPFAADAVEGLRTETDITFTEVTECGGTPCTVPGDVLAPSEGTDLPTIVLLNGGGTAFADRRYQAPLAAELAAMHDSGRLTTSVAGLAVSFVHMWLNRLCRSDARRQEYVTYALLARVYEARAARARS